jgi:hypothetical protein
MRILRILTVIFAILLISSTAFAQDSIQPFQEDPPTFSIGFSLGFPSGYHVSILDFAGVQGLRLRGDIGAFSLILLSELQVDLNIEYHFAQPRDIGFYFGVGVVAFSISVIGEFPNPDNGAWRFGFTWVWIWVLCFSRWGLCSRLRVRAMVFRHCHEL